MIFPNKNRTLEIKILDLKYRTKNITGRDQIFVARNFVLHRVVFQKRSRGNSYYIARENTTHSEECYITDLQQKHFFSLSIYFSTSIIDFSINEKSFFAPLFRQKLTVYHQMLHTLSSTN